MVTRKRNEWLEADESEEDLQSGSELEESRGRAITGRKAKRQRRESEDDTEDDEQSDEESDHDGTATQEFEAAGIPPEKNQHRDESVGRTEKIKSPQSIQSEKSTARTAHQNLTIKQAERANSKAQKTGVVYISRIPPFMKPHALRQLLQPFGEIGRVFLTPEDAIARQQRVRQGGNKKKTFTDGWVEFMSKRCAKAAAATLNTQIIGGKKGGFYHDDIWNIKYLQGFKWRHLTEQIANENAERAARMRAEIARTTRENKEFVQNVERAKMLENMEAKKRRRQDDLANEPNNAKAGVTMEPVKDGLRKKGEMIFKQNEVEGRNARKGKADEQPEDVRRVLSKIF